eukprot:TRINITY_DN848_c0_g1_i5.p1 TRINITY_DN848_c0_g1~~TRINITY_DN848_c0_g1_i5.p1  ORF type:complete len:371 (-),score=79.31 TRINITY_DN848_c0_g1_i5:69-1181(-)
MCIRDRDRYLTMLKFLFLLCTALLTNGLSLRKPEAANQCLRWTLTENEITEARGNVKRKDIKLYTTHNSASILIDGINYMKALYDDIELAGQGDFIHAKMFDQNADVMLIPNASDAISSRKTSVYNVLGRALKRGVTVRILANINIMQSYKAIEFCLRINLLCGYTCCGLDNRHPGIITGNLHTKMWIVKHGKDTIVYNGGMDVASGRWDTQKHDFSLEHQMNGDFMGHNAMHDQMVRITGPAVVDYERHFYERWNDPHPSFFPFVWLQGYKWSPPPFIRTKNEGLQIQIMRTLSCTGAKYGYYKDFAPKGEFTALAGIVKMAKLAKNYIYMEDQFFNFPEPMKAIADALPHLNAVIIVTDSQDLSLIHI